ncbi:2-hydroxyglutarate dehydrogenase [Trypanosoma grayi]|uniref:2-hydroxyglutarate dehydrogenase n=1 Tax=Trypanosoma grayi TaxID=71804 RepID=UPI0004F44C9C|nr:2-hydroxyglutarate dehydrogenase [Trypanosoma grayi]KEG10965.1 2-hydroxyglutarate dehydrogenase [Trypanosoma grayi]
MASKVFAWTCELGFLGGLCAAVKYKYSYENVPTDAAHTKNSFATFSKDSRREFYDVAIVGGGIVGVATAREIRKQFPKKRVILLEKEADVAQHQSGHNSGVVHAGMYYPHDSLMARLCPRGHDLMMAYCRQNKLPCERVGKLIVAADENEIPAIEKLYEQGVSNGVRELKMLRSEEEIKKVEPNVRGVCALYSPDTAVADFSAVARYMLKELQNGARGLFDTQFRYEALDFVGLSINHNLHRPKDVPTEMVLIRGREDGQLGPEKTIVAKNVITCCGLSNDLLARRSGSPLHWIGKKVSQTFSFRGRYYQLKPEARGLVSMNVYPAPDSRKALSVGVHFTPTVDERRGRQIIIGPGSAVTTHRYGYSPYCFDLEYCWNSFFSRGGWVNFISNITTVAKTFSVDVSRAAFLREAQKLVPSLKDSDIEESFCGVMGLAVTESGGLEMDLAMELSRPRTMIATSVKPDKVLEAQEGGDASEQTPSAPAAGGGGGGPLILNVRNAPSPAPSAPAAGGGGGGPLILNVRNAPSPAATSCMAIAEEIVVTAKKNFEWGV